MEWMILAAVVWMIFSAIQETAKNASKRLPPPDAHRAIAAPPEHVRHAPPAPYGPGGPFAVFSEASTSELEADELAGDTELQLVRASAAEVRSLEPVDHGGVVLTTTEARPLPVRAQSLEREVDWTAEHERFHRRYVDAPADRRPPPRDLLHDLRDPARLRRAMLMNEVLGPPVALREPRKPG